MAITIGSNITSLRAQRSLGQTSSTLGRIFERLSSGQRINHASDDAAGLAIASSLSKDARVFTQALRNVNDGISALNIAEGALSELSSLSIRQKELAAQAANGTYSLTQRRSMNKEANALVEEFNRIVESTVFNGIHLTDRSLSELRIQAGYGAEGSVGFGIGEALTRTVGDGSFSSYASYRAGASPVGMTLGDVNGDGALDMVASESGGGTISVFIGNGDGTFDARTSFNTFTGPKPAVLADMNGDGRLDIAAANGGAYAVSIMLGNGDGTFNAATSFAAGEWAMSLAVGDLNGDGILDMASADYRDDQASVYIGNGDGSFRQSVIYETGTKPAFIAFGDINGDERLDIVTADYGSNTLSVFMGRGDGSFGPRTATAVGVRPRSVALGDLNGDGLMDAVTSDTYGGSGNVASVLMGNGDGSFSARISYETGTWPWHVALTDLDGDGRLDMATADRGSNSVSVRIGNGDGTFLGRASYYFGSGPTTIAFGDLNGDQAIDVVTGDVNSNRAGVLLAHSRQVTTVSYVNICTRSGALQTIDTVEANLQRISRELGAIGSTQSRLAVTLNTLSASRENFAAASGRIMDADVAEEAANLTRAQILQQAGAAVLSQANQQPSLALRLLGGAT